MVFSFAYYQQTRQKLNVFLISHCDVVVVCLIYR